MNDMLGIFKKYKIFKSKIKKRTRVYAQIK